jgi:hypothetical protein
MSWLDFIPLCDSVYIYQAALVCEDCGRQIMMKLDKQKVENDGDSDSYPQGPYGDGGGEADNAQFCDRGKSCVNAAKVADHKIGYPLGNPLTTDGAEALIASIRRSLVDKTKYGRRIGRLLQSLWGKHYETPPTRLLISPHLLPSSLTKAGNRSKQFDALGVIENIVVCDSGNVYNVCFRDDVFNLLRWPVNDEGEFEKYDVAVVPRAAVENYNLEKLLLQAIADGAWD